MRRLAVLSFVVVVAACDSRRSWTEPWTKMRFVAIPSGSFVMGEPPDVPHRVVISKGFFMSATEVTQTQWTKVMGSNPSFFRDGGPNLPVERVTWYDVQAFLKRLNARGEGHFRLPTEAEWEYACRAGTEKDRLSTAVANYDSHRPTAVGSYPPNPWGLYDMHGNVWEWCADEYCPYPDHEVRDPVNQCGSRYKVIRGGSWYFDADSARCALRYTHEPQWRGFSIGFRVVRDDHSPF